MSRKSFILIGLIAFLLLAITGYFIWDYGLKQSNVLNLPTYFKYSDEELASLKNLTPEDTITVDDLKAVDDIMFDLIIQDKIGAIGANASKIYAYIYVAEQDVAYLSYNLHHDWVGSIEPITTKILCQFFPSQCSNINERIGFLKKNSNYSQQLAEIVFKKVKERMAEDDKNTHPYPEQTSPGSWKGVKPYYGTDIGSWKPWIVKNIKAFRAPPPPPADSPIWTADLAKMKLAYLNATPEQKKAVVFWAGGAETVTPPGIWLQYGEQALWDSHFSFEKILSIRATLAMGIADAMISAFDSKYTYWTARPFMRDPSIISIMPTPNFPGYPAGHSVISGAAAAILTYYFPDKKEHFEKLRDEASLSRVWGGIHLILDTEEGVVLGEKLGNSIVKNQMQTK